MTTCRWDEEARDYLTDGEPCRRDDYGDPTRHCTARRTCSVHIGRDELTCPRCLSRTRADLRRIPVLAALMEPVAVVSGVNSEALNLAGPAADPEAWTWRKVAARQGRSWHLSLVEEDDERHAYTVLVRNAALISEDYGHEQPEQWTVTNAADYLDRQLARIANDETQDWALLATEIRKCRRHYESVASLITRPEHGAPCPICQEDGRFVRLVRQYSHWCDDAYCERIHVTDDSEDVWTCRRNREHKWTHAAYSAYLEEREGA